MDLGNNLELIPLAVFEVFVGFSRSGVVSHHDP